MKLRIATFNVENLDDKPNARTPLEVRIRLMQAQLMRLNADILCLQEVNSLSALTKLIAGTPYADYHVFSTSNDHGEAFTQHIVILSRFPVLMSEQVLNQLNPGTVYQMQTAIPYSSNVEGITWPRPILHVVVALPSGGQLHVLSCHLKSKLPTTIPGQTETQGSSFPKWKSASAFAEGSFISSMQRVGQAIELRMLVDDLFDNDPNALIVVCGDFNADADEVPLAAIQCKVEDTENPRLGERTLVLCEKSVPETVRYSLLHHGKGVMIDHVLISRSLLPSYRHSEIHNEVLHDESAAFATDEKFPESDHAPVVAEFELMEAMHG